MIPNIKRYYAYRIVQSCMFIGPIFGLFLIENGLSFTEMMILEAWYAFVILALEVPTGIFADRYGRKMSLFLSSAFLVPAFFMYGMSSSFIGFAASEFVFAIASALYNGANHAFVYDSLKERSLEKQYLKVHGSISSIESVMFAAVSASAGFIALAGYRVNFFVSILPSLFAALIVWKGFSEPKIVRSNKKFSAHLKEALVFSFSHKEIRFLIVYFMLVDGVMQMMWLYYQPFFFGLGYSVKWIGILAGVSSLFVALGSKLSDGYEKLVRGRNGLLILALGLGLGLIGMSLSSVYSAVLFYLFWSAAIGMYGPIVSHYMNEYALSEIRASVLSLKGMAKQMVYIFGSVFIGLAADYLGVRAVFAIAGCFMILIALLMRR